MKRFWDAVNKPAGFVVWVQGPCGPEIQRWADRPETSMHGTYWYEGNARVLAVVAVSTEDFAKPLDQLAMKYPMPKRDYMK